MSERKIINDPVFGFINIPKDVYKRQLVTYHLYASDTYPVDITDAGNLLETYLSHTEYEYTPISPWRQKRYVAVTAADRFGNESAPLELNAISETDMPLLNDGDIPVSYTNLMKLPPTISPSSPLIMN